jgi:hypothetical protein
MYETLVSETGYRWILLSEPTADIFNNEPKLDKQTGEQLFILDCVRQPVSGGSGETCRVRVPQSGLKGLSKSSVMGQVAFVGMKAIAYENRGRAKLAFRCVSVAAAS